jgi:DNA-binding MarR family transcriptional regulator
MSTSEMTIRPTHRIAQEMAQNTGFLLARLGAGVKTKAIAKAEEAGFELYDYSVLAILAEGDRETQSTIAATISLDPSRLVALLDSLEERGLIARQRDPHDRRRHVVSITNEGKRQLATLRGLLGQVTDEYLAPLGPEERRQFHGFLVRLACQNDPACGFAETDAQSNVL